MTFKLKEWIAKVTEWIAKVTAGFTPVEFTGTVGSGLQDGRLIGIYYPNSKSVTIHFSCRSSANISTSATLFTIPTEYRPPQAVEVPMFLYTSSTQGAYRGTLSTSGVITQSWSGSTRGVFGSVSYKL